MAMVTIDPSVPETPPGSGIRWDSANQTWVDTKNGYKPWNSASQSWGSDQAAPPVAPPLGAQYTAAQIAQLYADAAAREAAGKADTTNAAANTANAATNATNAANTKARNDQLHQEMLASQGLTAQQIANSYAHDKAQYGIDKANLLLNARQAQAKSLLDNANFQLNQNTVNAQARQKLGDQQLTALQMLQDRKGPQDWTRWDYITGMGGNAPKPIDSKTYSPLDMLAAQYQPSNIAPPPAFDPSGLDAGAYPDAAPSTIGPTGSGAQMNPSAPAGVPQIPGMTQYPMGQVPPGGAGAPEGMSAAGAASMAGTPGGSKRASSFLPQYAGGGTTTGAAVVGDAKSGKPTGHEEVAYASNNPETGVAELHVIPNDMIATWANKAMGRHDGIIMHGSKVPKEIAHILPRAAAGGTFTGAPNLDIEAGQRPGGGYGDSDGQGGGVPQYGRNQMADKGTDSGAGVPQYTPTQPMTAPSSAPQVGQPPVPGGSSAPQQMGSTAAAVQSSNGLNGAAVNYVGGLNYGGTAAPPPQSLGPAGYDPYRITQNKYSPTDMNNSPVLRMIRGQLPVNSFQGYGDYKPGVQSQGITDLPIGLNYADMLRMDPNRLAMLKGVYDNPETGISFDSIMNMARNAAPRTAGNMGVARAR